MRIWTESSKSCPQFSDRNDGPSAAPLRGYYLYYLYLTQAVCHKLVGKYKHTFPDYHPSSRSFPSTYIDMLSTSFRTLLFGLFFSITTCTRAEIFDNATALPTSLTALQYDFIIVGGKSYFGRGIQRCRTDQGQQVERQGTLLRIASRRTQSSTC